MGQGASYLEKKQMMVINMIGHYPEAGDVLIHKPWMAVLICFR